MGKTKYKGLRNNYQPDQKVKVMLGRDWFDAEVVKSNKKTVIVRTLFSKTKYRRVPVVKKLVEKGDIAEDFATAINATAKPRTTLEPYTVKGTKVVKLPRIRVKPIGETAPESKYEDPEFGKVEAPLLDYEAETKPESAADVLAELEKLIG